MIDKDLSRFMSKVKPIDSCWIWQRGLDKDGYGQFWVDGTTVRAHRFIYGQTHELSEGLELDHLCENKACVNPGHLEEVNRSVNSQRSKPNGCKYGHGAYDFVDNRGARCCRQCTRESAARHRIKQETK